MKTLPSRRGRRRGRVDGEEDIGAEGEVRIADRCLNLGGRIEEIDPFLLVEGEGEPIACNGEQV